VSTGQASIHTTSGDSGWPGLFWEAFRRSKNPMFLLDAERRHVDLNQAYVALVGYPKDQLIGRPAYELLADGPLMSAAEWRMLLRQREFTGTAELVRADGRHVAVEVAGHPEIVTGLQLVLFVAIRTGRFARRRSGETISLAERAPLSIREVDVVRLLADGLTGPEVAEELKVAHNTVRTHVRNAMVKSGAHSRAQLVALTLAEGLVFNPQA
jgi:PAS domain S-box-containing protein